MQTAEGHRPARYNIDRLPNGRVKYPGVDRGGFGEILVENAHTVVIKWPSGKHWVGRGMPPTYHPAMTEVLRKDEDGKVTLLISWKKERKKRAAHL